MTYEQDKVIRDKLVNTIDMASNKFGDWLKIHGKHGTMGLLSDETKSDPTYKNLNGAFQSAKSNLDNFLKKTKYNTKYKKEIMIDNISTEYLPNGKKNIYYNPSHKLFKKELSSNMKNSEIIKAAFEDLTVDAKKQYLSEHPKSKFANNRTPNSSEQKPKKKDNSEKIKDLEEKVKDKLDKIRELNTKLDSPNLTQEQKNKIHDRLDVLKDARKNYANQLFDLRN